MSCRFTRHFAVLNINGEHLVYRRDREGDENSVDILFEDGARAEQVNAAAPVNAGPPDASEQADAGSFFSH